MSNTDTPLVLVVGATGHTGGSIVKGLLASGKFRVAALVRPASQSKPVTEELRASGVEIRLGDLKDGIPKLKEALAGVDIVISSVLAWILEDQKDLFRAAKEVGVKRVVPCDFATPGKPGVRDLHDTKLDIRAFVEEIGVPHTVIDIGWWMQLILPLPTRSQAPEPIKAMTYTVHAGGKQKVLVTDLRHVGDFVARIIADPRTVNKAVMVWEDELTELEIHELGERVSGEADVLKSKRIYVSEEDIIKGAADAKAALAKDPANPFAIARKIWTEYEHSMFVLGENSLESAKALGYLDARELYPDFPKHPLSEFAEEFYRQDEPASHWLRGF
ncbi:NAD-P-binding protein [Trametes polyzona]|nr:NAD-P-binding protein [Trametes polyzona]